MRGWFACRVFWAVVALTTATAPAIASTQDSAQEIGQETGSNSGATSEAVTSGITDWPELIPTSSFASRSAMFDTRLSPDGSRFAYQVVQKKRTIIAIFDAATNKQVQAIDVGRSGKMAWFRWAGNDRILFSLNGNGYAKGRSILFLFLPSTKLMVHDLATSKTHFIGLDEQGLEGDDVLFTDPAGQYVLLSVSDDIGRDPSVYRLLLDGSGEGSAVLVQKRRKGIDEWWADNEGTVRLGMRWRGRSKVSFYYRGAAGEELIEVAKIKVDGEEIDSWDVMSVRAGTDLGYALVKDDRGFSVIREFDYRTGTAGKLVYSNPDWDVESAIIEADGDLVGATFVDEAPSVEWLDPELAKAQTRLEKALGAGRVRILDHVKDRRMIVWHGAANDPGVIYVYSPAVKKLDLFAQLRPNVDFKQLSDSATITYQTRDDVQIEAYLTLPRAPKSGRYPLIILPHGGPYGVRDTRTYNDEVQLLANRGYAVIQPNFRGSGGYGESFVTLGDGQMGRKMQDDLDDAMDWAVAEGVADPTRICVVGASYGGYAALWAAIRNPERYRCAASWAGVTDLEEQLKFDNDRSSRAASRQSKRWKRKVEGDLDDFDLDDVSPARQIARLTRPILAAHGTRDRTVPFSQFEELSKAAEKRDIPIEKLVIEGAGHSFGTIENEQAWYDALIAFLAKHNPSDRPLLPPLPPKEGDHIGDADMEDKESVTGQLR